MNFGESLNIICNELKPETILEFGSGESTLVFAEHGKVTTIEYDPPGDWYGVAKNKNVNLKLIPQENEPFFPKNLLEIFFNTVVGSKLLPQEDPLSQLALLRGRQPKWDLAYIDGAVHVNGFEMDKKKPGWAGGDLSYITRTTIAGLCLQLCKYVLVDDITFMPKLKNLKIQPIADRFFIMH